MPGLLAWLRSKIKFTWCDLQTFQIIFKISTALPFLVIACTRYLTFVKLLEE
jgi:hypothetical protein